MGIRVLVFILLSVLLAGPATAQLLPVPPGWQMERAVLLSRHGVRAPVRPNAELDQFVATPWPTWPVPPGFLTPRGAELMRLMGGYYRVLFGGRGLVRADDCPPLGSVSAWTDLDQRTRVTGASILAGMYPRCGTVNLRNQDNPTIPDPLFHPAPTPSCPMDGASNRAAVLERIGGNFSSVLREYAPQLALMQATLCPPAVTGGKQCGLPSQAPSLESRPDGAVHITGPIAMGASAAEDFVMENGEGLPSSQVAWGRLSGEAQLQDLLKIHRLEVDLTEKTLPIARQRGSNLLSQITTTLQDGHKFPGQPKVAEPVRFALLVGHHTNIANVARLLNVGWQIEGYQPNEIAPGGALAFELMRDVRTDRRYVRLAYYAQTVEQMRGMVKLDAVHPPGMTAVPLPACAPFLVDGSCPVERFVEIANQAVEPGCVTIRP
ncbi:AppA family phytase/histidine-type acid phosphatase [soil metagenome]